VVFGPQPREVLARLRDLNCAAVLGNTDAWALEPRPHGARDEDTQRVFEIELWGARQLASAGLDYLRTFQPTVEMPLGGGRERLLAFHGSPRSDVEVIVATTPEDELAEMLSGSRATVMAGGHTHQQMLRRYDDATLINPGSVGLPYERVRATDQVRHPLWAEYALVSWENDVLSIQFRRVPWKATCPTPRGGSRAGAEELRTEWFAEAFWAQSIAFKLELGWRPPASADFPHRVFEALSLALDRPAADLRALMDQLIAEWKRQAREVLYKYGYEDLVDG
jgi:hypothetical protein